MLVVLNEPIVGEDLDTLAVNIDNLDSIIVNKNQGVFELAARRYLGIISDDGGLQRGNSVVSYLLATFDSMEDCLECFDFIVSAYKGGDEVCDLRHRN